MHTCFIELSPMSQYHCGMVATLSPRTIVTHMALPTLDDRCIQTDGGDLLVRATPSDLLHHFLVDLRHGSQ